MKRAILLEASMSTAPGQDGGLVGNNPHRRPLNASKSDRGFGAKSGLDFEEVLMIQPASVVA